MKWWICGVVRNRNRDRCTTTELLRLISQNIFSTLLGILVSTDVWLEKSVHWLCRKKASYWNIFSFEMRSNFSLFLNPWCFSAFWRLLLNLDNVRHLMLAPDTRWKRHNLNSFLQSTLRHSVLPLQAPCVAEHLLLDAKRMGKRHESMQQLHFNAQSKDSADSLSTPLCDEAQPLKGLNYVWRETKRCMALTLLRVTAEQHLARNSSSFGNLSARGFTFTEGSLSFFYQS